MPISLLSSKFLKHLHITLAFAFIFSFQKLNAQEILLPGDVVIVTANAENNSFGFIPLIDIEEGTRIFFSNQLPNEPDNDKKAVQVHFRQPIPAGTNVNIGLTHDERIEITGQLTFTKQNQLFVYQKEETIERYIFAVTWGSPENDTTTVFIPNSLSEEQNTFVRLGEAANYQYYIRNGASGTANMLLRFVGDAANWQSDKNPFPALGTSFTLLNPPVVMFNNSYTNIVESDSMVHLELAIFEHDGSRLLVDVVYDSLRSITNQDDFNGFTLATVNFTGLVGDGNYEVEIPINDDQEYEGTETGIFTLKNLSKGNLGDFINHSIIIKDNEIPGVVISSIHNSLSQHSFIEIQNNEQGAISLKNWRIKSNYSEVVITEDISLLPGESLKIVDKGFNEEHSKNIITSELTNLLGSKGGEILLSTIDDEIVSRKIYSAAKTVSNFDKEPENDLLFAGNDTAVEAVNQGEHIIQQIANEQISGLKILPNSSHIFDLFPDMKFLSWSENLQSFKEVSTSNEAPSILFGYFENLDEAIQNLQTVTAQKASENSKLEVRLSATDVNENEILDGLEGLNLIPNNLEIAFPVQALIEALKNSNPDMSVNSSIYTMDLLENGQLSFKSKSGAETVAPGKPFWLLMNSLQDEINLTIEQAALENYLFEADTSVEKQELVFSISDGMMSDQITIQFPENQISENVKDISAYSAFNLPGPHQMKIAIQQGNERYSTMTIPAEFQQNISFPLYISGLSGTVNFKLNEGWEIPKDLEVFILDTKTSQKFRVENGIELQLEIEESASNQQEGGTEDNMASRYHLNFMYKSENQDLKEENSLVKDLELYQNYPNPFNPITTISFYLPESEEVKLSVFNIVGQPVAVLVNRKLSAGQQQFDWDATERPSGMYIYQLEVGNKVLTRKMTLVK